MNTPAHVLLNAVALNRGNNHTHWQPVMIGALLPDAPMFVFYLYQKAIGTPEMIIWKETYFDPQWQTFFDIPNALPLILIGLALASWRKHRFMILLFTSMALHVIADLPLHHDDAHRHFWPISDWRFASPVSYWDPAHHGLWASAVEFTMGMAAAAYLGLKRQPRCLRITGLVWGVVYLAYGLFVLVFWILPNRA